MSIIRTEKTNNYSVICNQCFRDEKLSARAKGVFAYIMTLPDNWTLHKKELYRHFKEGREAINTAFKELEDVGYITKQAKRDKSGKMSGWSYTVKETVTHNKAGSSVSQQLITEEQTTSQKTVSPETRVSVSPTVGDPAPTKDLYLPNTDLTKDSCTKQSLARVSYSDSFESWWATYKRNGSSKRKAYDAWKGKRLEGQHEMMIAKTAAYRASVERAEYMKHAERFISYELYNEEFSPYRKKSDKPGTGMTAKRNADGVLVYY